VLVTLLLSLVIAVIYYKFNFKPDNYASKFQPAGNFTSDKYKKSPAKVSLLITGDVMLGRTVMIKSIESEDPTYPFRKVGDRMRTSDIVFINLENPVIESCPFHETGFVFCADLTSLDGLLFAGVDVANLANNHSLNYGKDGLDQTVKHLGDRGIMATGLGELIKIERGGINFGFLGFDKSQQVNPVLTEKESELIKKSDAEVDVLVIAMHWGVEYQNRALPGVRNIARKLVDLGADVVVGHHPHWVQDWEFIDGVPVFYSLGNFVFDQMWSEETKKGMAVKLVYENGVLKDYELMPTYMSSWAQPEFVEE
jgi:poly-gamma-glutamate synthesis protein (capsule biosynthesis protein)